MKERKYFLVVENLTKLNFIRIKDDGGIKVVLPSYITSDRFKKLSTESEFVRGETPELCIDILKNKYKDYDIFYLNISSNIVDWDDYKRTGFELSSKSDITVAFVCFPKNNPDYKKQPKKYMFHVETTLAFYYNDVKDWVVYVVDENFSENYLDRCYFFHQEIRYYPLEKEFLSRCKNKYGIPESEIRVAKHIMNTRITANKIAYKLKPDFVKKFRIVKQLRKEKKFNGAIK